MKLRALLSRRPAAWEHAPFRALSAAWVTTNIGDSALYLMAAVWVKDLTGSDAAAGIVFAIMGIATLLAPLLGQLVDRTSRRTILIVANAIGAGLVCLLLPLTADRIWLLYIVIFGYGAIGALTGAAQGALLRDMLPDEHLASGNGLLSTIDQAFRLLSPLLGTALYVAVGPRAVVVLTAVCFVVTALLLLRVRVTESEPEPADGESYLSATLAGFRHIARTPLLARTTVMIGTAFAATGLFNITAFPIIEQGLGLPASSLGVLTSVQGVGAVLGGVTVAAAIGRWAEPRVFAVGLSLIAVAGLSFLVGNVLVVGAGMALVGFSVTWALVAFVTLRQRMTSPRLQGRTSAASNLAVNVPQAMLTLVGAALLAAVDYRWLIAGTVVGIMAAAIPALTLRAPQPSHPEAETSPAS